MPYGHYHTVILPIRRNIQDTDYDCGPASLKIVLETMNKFVDEKYLMEICGAKPKFSTKPELISKAFRKFRVKHMIYENASIKLIEEKISKLNLCLINYQAWENRGGDFKKMKAGHYSVIFGFNATHFFIADPNKKRTSKYQEWGFRTVRKNLLNERWKDKKDNGEFTRHWMITVPLVQNSQNLKE